MTRKSYNKRWAWMCGGRNIVLATLSFSMAGVLSAQENFRVDVLPVLTKAGCNSGACHGAATGQGGFKLSLLGYDPELDYYRITHELGGRRIDRARPAQSLFLLKPSKQLEHEGGRRLPRNSAPYAAVLHWIENGAAYGARDLRVVRITVSPEDSLLVETNQTLPLTVRATLSDGSEREVTAQALYSSNDDALAEVNKEGQIRVRAPGVTSIMIRYGGQVAAARVTLPFGSSDSSTFPPNNFIDEHIDAELKRLGLSASPLSERWEFLRRVYLDLAGRLPEPETVRQFLATPDAPVQREQMIERLLSSSEFVDLWTMHWAELLLITAKRGGEKAAFAYQGWLREQIRQNRPVNEVVRSLLTARGSLTENPPANFLALANDPRDLAEQTSRIFLGTQIACARCHAHPADRWTQRDYYGFAAYFARLEREHGSIEVGAQGEIDDPKTGRPVPPQPLGGSGGVSKEDRLQSLADWMTSGDNPFFARAIVNRTWKYFFGRGLVEPVDDLRPTNPATHPGLLDALTADFVASGFDQRRLIRLIVSSRTYQLSSRPCGNNVHDDRFYSHAAIRELPPQVYLDAIAQVTGVEERFKGYDAGTRAVQLVGVETPSYALDVLGRCPREATCDRIAQAGGGMALALHFINGGTINSKLHGRLTDDLSKPELSDEERVTELYLRTLSRMPRAAELTEWVPLLKNPTARNEAIQDLLWALLNSREFAFNH